MPSLVPATDGEPRPQYFVLCDYGPNGRAWYDADPNKPDRDTVLQWLIEGQYTNPVQVLELNLPAGTCRDVSADSATMLQERSTNCS
jgi:hypothetical protein